MRPTPVPDIEMYPGAQRVVIAAPGGDLTDDVIEPIEVLTDVSEVFGCRRYSVRLLPEDGDVERLLAGGVVWVSFYGQVPVFSVDVKGPGE